MAGRALGTQGGWVLSGEEEAQESIPSLPSPTTPYASLTLGPGLSSGHLAQLNGVNAAQGLVPAWTTFGPEQWDKRPEGWNSDVEQGIPRLLPCSQRYVPNLSFVFCSAFCVESPPFCSR